MQTYNKKFKIAVTFLNSFRGISNINTRNSKVYFTTKLDEDDSSEIIFLPGDLELES